MTTEAQDDELAATIAGYRDDPYGFVMFIFPWGAAGTALENQMGPVKWQQDILLDLGRQVSARDATPSLPAIRIACAGGHGVGHSALIAWIHLWFISTRADPAVIVTANTQGQLLHKTWPELRKWHEMAIHGHWFEWTATTFGLKAPGHTHCGHAIPWLPDKPERFLGCFAQNILVAFDEPSAIPSQIWDVMEGTVAGCPDAIWLAFGKPTATHEKVKGEWVETRFRQCWTNQSALWTTYTVDSRAAKMVNRAVVDGWIADYGENSDFVRVRVRGVFAETTPVR